MSVEEVGTRRVDGQLEYLSSEDSYSTEDDEKDREESADGGRSSDGQYTNLETVDARFLSGDSDNIYRNITDNMNVIEFEQTPILQAYDIQNVQLYYEAQNTDNSLPSSTTVYPNQHFTFEENEPSYKQNGVHEYINQIPCQNQGGTKAPHYPFPRAPQITAAGEQKPSESWGYTEPPPQTTPGNAGLFLCNWELWSKFHNHTTEMIVTKKGRRMFPVLEFSMTDLLPSKVYNVYINLILVDNIHWKFQNGKWIAVGVAEKLPKTERVYLHPDSPNTGAHWMKQDIIFNKLKLTNDKRNLGGHIVVNSMHKYQPRVNVIEVGDPKTLQTQFFPETQFITVTAYQNTDITQLKIDHNPFAKGFRDTQESHSGRQMTRILHPGYAQMGTAPQISTASQDQRFSPTALHGQQISPSSHGQQISPSSHGQQLSPSSHGQQISPSSHGQQISPSSHGQQISPSSHGQQISPSSHGQQLSPSSHGQQISQSSHGQQLSPSSHGQQISQSSHGQQISQSSHGQQISQISHGQQISPISHTLWYPGSMIKTENKGTNQEQFYNMGYQNPSRSFPYMPSHHSYNPYASSPEALGDSAQTSLSGVLPPPASCDQFNVFPTGHASSESYGQKASERYFAPIMKMENYNSQSYYLYDNAESEQPLKRARVA